MGIQVVVSNILYVHPENWGNDPKLTVAYFFRWVAQPPTYFRWLHHRIINIAPWKFGCFFSRLLRWVPLTIQGFHDAWGTSLESPWTILTFLAPQDRGQDPPWAENATSGAAMAVVLCVFFFRPGEEDIYIDIPWSFPKIHMLDEYRFCLEYV